MSQRFFTLSDTQIQQLTVAARKALITADPLYLSWSEERKERFRACMSEQQRSHVDKVLLESLLNVRCSVDEVSEAWNQVPFEQLYKLNWAALLTRGIGDDWVQLNEYLADGVSLLDFPTLYAYDYDDHLFQESARRRDDPSYTGSAYFALRHPLWVRLIMDGRLFYATFMSLATHFIDEIEQAGNERIRQLIPHEYVEGEDNGKPSSDPEDGGVIWDLKVDANGLEGQLDELRGRWHKHCYEKWFELSQVFSNAAPAVYQTENTKDPEPNCRVIFNNAEVLKNIRWKHFLSDCSAYCIDLSTIDTDLAAQLAKSLQYLDENHQDIMENFDAKVAKLKKKRKIVLSPQALQDLSRLEIGEDD